MIYPFLCLLCPLWSRPLNLAKRTFLPSLSRDMYSLVGKSRAGSNAHRLLSEASASRKILKASKTFYSLTSQCWSQSATARQTSPLHWHYCTSSSTHASRQCWDSSCSPHALSRAAAVLTLPCKLPGYRHRAETSITPGLIDAFTLLCVALRQLASESFL